MELAITCGVILLVICYAVIRGSIDEKRRKETYQRRLKEQYGKFPDREYQTEDLESIPRLFQHKRAELSYEVDDITWNDLDMDKVFMMLNHTQSSSGAEYLYHMLRTPRMTEEGLDDWEKHVTYFMKEEQQRVTIQMLLHDLGRTGRFSLFDYLDYLETLEKQDNKKEIVALLLLVISIILVFANTSLGVVCMLFVMCYQIATYLKAKKKVLPYLSSFTYIMRMIDCAEKICREKLTDMSEYKQELKTCLESLSQFKKGYHILMQMNYTTGNPVELLIEYFKMITHLDLMQFNRTLNQVQGNQQKIEELAQQIGYLDTVIAVGAFRASLPYYCVPILSKEAKELCLEEGYHTAIRDAVPNSFRQKRGMLVTGSNASGKSTFLKMAAINTILAQTIHTCAAKAYEGNYFRIYSSMALRDSLESGESYYIVEIKALKRIMDAAADDTLQNPLLCFVDEVLRGTNTIERIAASTKILENLSKEQVFCFAATHDIELTHVLETQYDNFHFEEEIKDGDVLFSYHLKKGRAVSRNAIRLLQVIGFDEAMIQSADRMAANFMETGEWEEV